MRIFKLLLFSSISFLMFSVGNAQDDEIWYKTVSIPPSPNAASLGKYGEFPVDKSTGVPSISIPLYEINYGGIIIPISLSYHASGIKVNEEESWVGMGWSLNAGGVITRVMKCRPDDEIGNGFLANLVVPLKEDVDADYYNPNCLTRLKLANISDNGIDYEPDLFFYNFSGYSGSFNFNNNGGINTRPKQMLKIEYTTTPNLTFTITDSRGLKYYFDILEKTKYYIRDGGHSTSQVYISTWYLRKVENILTGKSISFGYQNRIDPAPNIDINISQTKNYLSNNTGRYDYLGENFPIYDKSEFLEQKYPLSIVYGEGRVEFNSSDAYPYHRRLDNLIIKNNNETIKKFVFGSTTIQSTSNCTTRKCYRQKLVNLNEEGSDGYSYNKTYFFHYDSQALPSKDSYNVDHWGYFNGANNQELVPFQTIATNQTAGTADRDPHWPYTKAGILEQIDYPTGGYTRFEYESNLYATNSVGGGVRVKTIKSFDPDSNNEILKTYDYCNSGYLTLGTPVYKTIVPRNNCPDGELLRLVLYSTPVAGLGASPNSVAYGKVIEFFGSSSNNTGKIETEFMYASDEGTTEPLLFFPSLSNQWVRSNRLREVAFIRNSLNGYDTVRKSKFSYKSTAWDYTKGFKASVFETNEGDPTCSGSFPCTNANYIYKNFEIPSFNYLQEQETTSEYTNNVKTVEVKSIIKYDDLLWRHFNPVEKNEYGSDGSVFKTSILYPFDYTGEVYTYLTQHHILDLPIKQTRTDNNNSILSEYEWNYGKIYKGAGIPELYLLSAEELNTESTPGSFRTVVSYDIYDIYGNPTQIVNKEGIETSYLWGYNGELLIAKVDNAKVSDIFYESFEEGGGDSPAGDAYTGRYSKKNGFKVDLVELFPGNYILSYSTFQASTGKWIQNQETKTVNSTGTFSIDISGQVDEVRFYPEKAQMTTFNYLPQVGVISMTDLNGQATTFKYDPLGRLVLIKDFNGNILKQYSYNYKSLGQ